MSGVDAVTRVVDVQAAEPESRSEPIRAPNQVPPLDPDGCQVWWARLDDAAGWHRRLLDPVERRRRERYRAAGDRDRFTLGVVLSRLVLGAQQDRAPTDVAIDRDCRRCGRPHARPRLLDGRRLDFSITHSGGLVGLAVARGVPGADGGTRSVGVDLERVVPLREPGMERVVLSVTEQTLFDRLPPGDQVTAFYRYWVRKEAILKATGDGLTVPLTGLSVSAADRPARLLAWAERPELVAGTTMQDLEAAAGYAASLAVIGRPVTVQELDAGALLIRPR